MLLNLSVWLVVGGVMGWLAGAAIGGWIMAPLGAVPGINEGIVGLVSICAFLAGATMLLAAIYLFPRRQSRAA